MRSGWKIGPGLESATNSYIEWCAVRTLREIGVRSKVGCAPRTIWSHTKFYDSPISPHLACRMAIAANGAVSVRNTLGPSARDW